MNHGDRVLHTRLDETGTVVEDGALPTRGGDVWVRFDGRQPGQEVLVSGHLLKRLREQRVTVSAHDWDLLLEVLRQSATRALHRDLVAGVVERAQRIV